MSGHYPISEEIWERLAPCSCPAETSATAGVDMAKKASSSMYKAARTMNDIEVMGYG